MITVRQMKSDLKKWGVSPEYIGTKKIDIEPVYERCRAIKTLYKGYLEWNDIGAELNHWLARPDVPLDKISEKLLAHKNRTPEDIGKK